MMMQTRYDKYQRMDVDEILPGLYLCKYTSIFKGKKCNFLDFLKFGLSDLWGINVISIFVPFPLSILAALNLSSPDN